jgi:hypothetical protein
MGSMVYVDLLNVMYYFAMGPIKEKDYHLPVLTIS